MITPEPRGIFLEGTVSGTPYPGTVMQVVAATAPISGNFTWGVYSPGADGDPRIWSVLLEDKLQGTPFSTAYVSGTQCNMYVPIPGEFMNMLVAGESTSGGANTHTIGDRFIVQHNTGVLIVTATSNVSSPFMCMETATLAVSTQGWLWCMRT